MSEPATMAFVDGMKTMTGDRPFETAFIIGAPRSGTTWLQLLLQYHPQISTVQETHIFNYLDSIFERNRDPNGRFRPYWGNIGPLFTGAEKEAVIRAWATLIMAKIAAKKPDATIALEKTPVHVIRVPTILSVFPAAKILHIVRDPRAVSASIMASKSFIKEFPGAATEAAEIWRSNVESGLGASYLTPNYRLVTYESLLEDGPATILSLFEWLGVPANRDLAEQALAEFSFERLKNAPESIASAPWPLEKEPVNFFRRGVQDGWKTELTKEQVLQIESVAGPLMATLGYTPR